MHRYWETIVEPVLLAFHPKNIVEIGTESGKNTDNLLGYCKKHNAKLYSVDPFPGFDVATYEAENGPHFKFFRSLSLNAIPLIDEFDLVFIDGDHNWYTVFNELKLIEKQCKKSNFEYPLIFFHDVGWPYARRDLYYNPENIPEAYRKPYQKKGMKPGSGDLLETGGLNPDLFNSIYENDLQNGVLTAIEDFIAQTDLDITFIQIPGLYGFGIIIPERLMSTHPDLEKIISQFYLGDAVKKHIENVEMDRVEKQIIINKKLDEVSVLREMRDKESHAKQEKQNQINHLEKQIHKINIQVVRLKNQLQSERKHYVNQIDSLASWIEKLDYGINELLSSKRWELASTIGELMRKIRFRPKVPMVEDYLGKVFNNYRTWKEQSKIEAGPGDKQVFGPLHPHILKRNLFDCFNTGQFSRSISVDIVICVYNALPDVRKCLDSVMKNTGWGDLKFTLIIVNDGSDDETTQFLCEFDKLWENCSLLHNAQSSGYTVAANQGLKRSESDYVVLLNSDTIVPVFWLERILECGESDPEIGIIGPLSNAASWQSIPELFDKNGDWAVNELPDQVSVEEMSKLVAISSEKSYPRVPFINGFCFAVKRTVIDKIGYLDEIAFPKGYGEENDFCLRAAQAGFALAIADHAYVYHAKSKSYSHQRRLKLASQGGKALKKKYPDQNMSDLTNILRNNLNLKKTRGYFREFSKHPDQMKRRLSNSLVKALFVLPVEGGGGGSHSIVQEVFGMRCLGFDAQVAIRKIHKPDYYKDYQSLLDQDENLFYMFENDSELISYAKKFNVVIGTINYSIKLIKKIVDAHSDVMPVYYIQDYEPLFYREKSEKWQIAFDSYSLIPGMVLMAKTDWLCDIVYKKQNLKVNKVCPSIDRSVYFPSLMSNEKNQSTIRVSAMVRPSSPRRSPELTMAVLKKLKNEYDKQVDIHIFGCRDDETGFKVLDREFQFKNHGVLTREEVADLLRSCEIFVDFSTYQAFGRTGLEAMACGCAVILPMEGGVHEYAVHGNNGFIVDTSSKKECYAALSEMVSDEKKRKQMIKNAIKKSVEFSIPKSAISELNLFTEQWNDQFKLRQNRKIQKKKQNRSGKPVIHSMLTGSNIKHANGSYYIRHYLPFTYPSFQEKFDSSMVTAEDIFKKDPDVLVVPRVALADEEGACKLLEHCHKNGIQAVYETDDHLFGLPSDHPELEKYQPAVAAAKIFAEHADMIITSSDQLKDKFKIYNKNVRVIPNSLDERLWQPSKIQTRDNFLTNDPVIRILYMGTYTHLNDLLIVEDAIKKIVDKWGQKVAFDVIGIAQDQKDQKWMNSIKIPNHSYPKFVKWLCAKSCWSIGIAPLEETEFNNCKSYIKYLDYAALGVAPVCSNLSPYQSVIKTGVNGLLVNNSTDEWFSAIDQLIDDQALRLSVADRANQDFLQRHTLKTETQKWIDAFQELTVSK